MQHPALCLLLLGGLGVSAGGSGAQGDRIVTRSYECVTPPNYWGWRQPVLGDKGQLSDGRVLDSWAAPERAARALLREGVRRVLAVDDGRHWAWKVPKDRSLADRVRVDVLRALQALGAAGPQAGRARPRR